MSGQRWPAGRFFCLSPSITGRLVMEDRPRVPTQSEKNLRQPTITTTNTTTFNKMSMLATASPSPHPPFGMPRPWEAPRCPDYTLRPRSENERIALPSIRQVGPTTHDHGQLTLLILLRLFPSFNFSLRHRTPASSRPQQPVPQGHPAWPQQPPIMFTRPVQAREGDCR